MEEFLEAEQAATEQESKDALFNALYRQHWVSQLNKETVQS